MIVTIDTKKKLVQMKSSVNVQELCNYLEDQYGADWVNYKLIPSQKKDYITYVENNYYPEITLGLSPN